MPSRAELSKMETDASIYTTLCLSARVSRGSQNTLPCSCGLALLPDSIALRSFMRASNEDDDGLLAPFALKPDTFPEPNAFLGDGDTGALCVENVGPSPNLGSGVSARF